MANRAEVETIMAEWPDLTFVGFFTPGFKEQPADREARKVEDRARMLTEDALEQFEWSCRFIAENLEIGPRVNANVSSYGLKHRAEEWHSARGTPAYVANGMFIAAMIDQGFRVFRSDGPNCFFNITPASLKRTKP
jgi:hypothetical protein